MGLAGCTTFDSKYENQQAYSPHSPSSLTTTASRAKSGERKTSLVRGTAGADTGRASTVTRAAYKPPVKDDTAARVYPIYTKSGDKTQSVISKSRFHSRMRETGRRK